MWKWRKRVSIKLAVYNLYFLQWYRYDNFIVFHNYYALFLIFVVVLFLSLFNFNILRHENSSYGVISTRDQRYVEILLKENAKAFCKRRHNARDSRCKQDTNLRWMHFTRRQSHFLLFWRKIETEIEMEGSTSPSRSKANSRLHKAWDVGVIRIRFISSFVDFSTSPYEERWKLKLWEEIMEKLAQIYK